MEGIATTAGSNSLGVVPAGRTWIVKDVRYQDRSAGARLVTIFVKRGGSAGGVTLAVDDPLPALAFANILEAFVVLEPGDELFAYLDVSGDLSYWVSGADLDGVA